jgi:hypothetical protein
VVRHTTLIEQNVHHLAIALSAFLLIYHQATTWIPLFPWNDLERFSRREIALETAFNGLLMGTGLVCVLVGKAGFSHWYPLIYYPFLLMGECIDWWIPYFQTRSPTPERFGITRPSILGSSS